MKILFCNKYNYPFSGTEAYLFELMDLLRSHGHEVALFSMADSRGEPTPYDHHFVKHIEFKRRGGWWDKAKHGAHAIYSTEARGKIRKMIREFQPDVAHVRNIYHHLSPSILWELRAQRVPTVYHVNDFKVLCPSYNLVSRGDACERCKGGALWHALAPRCYPGVAARMSLVAEAYAHRWAGTYRKCIDLFLAPSQFVRDKFGEHGWDTGKFEVLPHFQRLPEEPYQAAREDGPILYVGRLSKEKGVADLVQAMKRLPYLRLIVAGEGPERANLERLAAQLGSANIEFAGQVTATERDTLIARSRFTVMPSHAYETFGKTILESYALGRAVVASDRGSRRELVLEGATGLLYPCGDSQALAKAIERLASDPELAMKMGLAGWELVRRGYTPEDHYLNLIGIYERLIFEKTGSQSSVTRPTRLTELNKEVTTMIGRMQVAEPQRKNLRIAFIGGRGVISKYSGIEAYYEEIGARLAERGHEVTVYCRNHFTPAIPEHNGMRLVRLPTIRTKHFETLLHTLLSTVHALVSRYDVVHYHALGPALFSFIPRLRGMKTLVTVQGLDWQRKKWGRLASAVLRLGEDASVRLPNATMVVSRALQDRYRDLHGAEVHYVPNGGVLRKRSEPKKIFEWGLEPGKYVLFLGRFSPEKGCHLLVEAFERLETDVTLVMAGASSYCDEYSRELRTHANERIRILDWVSGEVLDELLTNAMIFVLPSDMEGLSLALLDGMGAGLCVLASDIPENREAVEGAGFTFRCGSVDDLADKLRVLIANPTIRAAAGKAARRRVEDRYQWDDVTREIEAVYFSALGWKTEQLTPKKPSQREIPASRRRAV